MKKHYQLFIARKERNLTSKDMGRLIGCSPNRFLLKEQKKAYFTLDEAKTLAAFFGKTIDELFPSDEDKKVG